VISLYTVTTPPHDCSYLPGRAAQMRYDFVGELSPAEYGNLMLAGWRRFGRALFRPACPACDECRPIRIDVANFRPNSSQRRAAKTNAGVVELTVGEPGVTDEKLALYDRYHEFQHGHQGWPDRGPKAADDYIEAFVDQPFPVEEWRFTVAGKLVGVGYVDPLPVGLSAIYFYYDPDERGRSLGTLNVLRLIAAAAARGDGYLYLGYHVAGCRSLEYKANFRPHERLVDEENWMSSEKV
jgi:arginyl-tRNA--protein-N-Asp/Glu arginylyltransferase